MPKAHDRIFTLDVLRGLAALSVVFWHWQHFFYVDDHPLNFHAPQQPLFETLSIFYKHGSLAVELFFCISGFVFFWLFSNKITDRKIPAPRFFWDRFSRLYPLHIVTLAIVAGLQFLYTQEHAEYFVYQVNDAYHALLNVLLIPAWGFESGWSYNAPIWSVSVEVLLYGTFFLLCLTKNLRYFLLPCLVAIGFVAYPLNYKLGSGLFTFFCGGMAFLLLERLRATLSETLTCCITLILALVSWVIIVTQEANMYLIMGVAFPASVMFLASLSFMNPDLMKPYAAIGDLSYSSYLLHFPLQIVFAIVVDRLGYGREIFYSPWMLGLFMAVLIPLSFASHRLFEVPVQRALRSSFRRWKGRKPDITLV